MTFHNYLMGFYLIKIKKKPTNFQVHINSFWSPVWSKSEINEWFWLVLSGCLGSCWIILAMLLLWCKADSQETQRRQGQLCKWTPVAWFEVEEKCGPAQILLIFISKEESHCNLCLNWMPAVTQPSQNKKYRNCVWKEPGKSGQYKGYSLLSLRRLQPPSVYCYTDF